MKNLLDFNKAIETIRMLDKTPKNEKFIFNESERLTKKRKEVEQTGSLNWEQSRTSDNAPGAGKKSGATPIKKKF